MNGEDLARRFQVRVLSDDGRELEKEDLKWVLRADLEAAGGGLDPPRYGEGDRDA